MKLPSKWISTWSFEAARRDVLGLILFVVELGGGFGHVRRMLPLARAALTEGHQALFLVSNPHEVSGMLAANGCAVEPLPLPRRATRVSPRPGEVATTYADIIAGAGLLDGDYLLECSRAWDAAFESKRPLAVVSESSPFLSVAKQDEAVPLLVTGHGFALPPPNLLRFPALTDRAPLYDEARLLEVVASVRKARSQASPRALPELLAGPRHAVTGLDELDPYRTQRLVRNYGPLELESRYAADDPCDDVFAYLLGDRESTLPLLAALAAAGVCGRLFVRRGTAEQRAAIANSRLVWLEEPAQIGDALARARLVVHHGSMLLAEESLVAGRPQAIVPLYLEHLLTTRALLELGVAIALPPGRNFADLTMALRAALANDLIFRSAQRWALQHANDAWLDRSRARELLRSVVGARN